MQTRQKDSAMLRADNLKLAFNIDTSSLQSATCSFCVHSGGARDQ